MNDSGQHESETLDPASLGPAGHDPIVFELFKNAIFSIADEMALTVFRTTYSGVLKDNMDYSTGFADAYGTLVAQGLTLPAHLGSVPTAMRSIMRRFRDDIHPGDVFIMNDPFDGGMHLPDIFVVKPLYHAGERIAFACTVCHHGDVGGRVAGLERLRLDRDLRRGAAHPPAQVLRARPAEPHADGDNREERAPAGAAVRRSARRSLRPATSPKRSSRNW